jgi:putative ABC transport system permease protein
LVLILISSGPSYWKQQGMEKDFLIDALRTIVQLILLGYFLNWIFKNNSLPIILAAAFLMTFNSALHSRSRVEVKYKGLLLDNLLATALAIWPLAFLGTALLHAEPLRKVEVFLASLRDASRKYAERNFTGSEFLWNRF